MGDDRRRSRGGGPDVARRKVLRYNPDNSQKKSPLRAVRETRSRKCSPSKGSASARAIGQKLVKRTADKPDALMAETPDEAEGLSYGCSIEHQKQQGCVAKTSGGVEARATSRPGNRSDGKRLSQTKSEELEGKRQ